jgi:hypothetical protein
MVKDVRWILRLVWLVHWFITVITSFCGWSSGNGETKIQKCAKINNKWKRCEMDTTTWMVKWSNYQDGCVMTNSWLVKQKCKEFVKVAIEWIWCDMFNQSAVGHNTSILVVGSFHHSSRSIHLTSFTISNCIYWIHLNLVWLIQNKKF